MRKLLCITPCINVLYKTTKGKIVEGPKWGDELVVDSFIEGDKGVKHYYSRKYNVYLNEKFFVERTEGLTKYEQLNILIHCN